MKLKRQFDDEKLPVVQFPKQFWIYRPEFWSFFYATLWNKIKFGMPIMHGGDEYGRHTRHFSIPGIIGIAIPYEWCGPGCPDYDDEDFGFKDWRCAFPGCPAFSMGGQVGETHWCMVHDTDFWRGWVEEEKAKLPEERNV